MAVMLAGEFGAVIEGEGLAPGKGQGSEAGGDGLGERGGGLAREAGGQEEAGVACMAGDDGRRAAALASAPPAVRLSLGASVPPRILCLAGYRGLDEARDGLVGADRLVARSGQAPRHVLRRPAVLAPRPDGRPQGGVAVELGAGPAAGTGLLVGIAWLVVLGGRGIAV